MLLPNLTNPDTYEQNQAMIMADPRRVQDLRLFVRSCQTRLLAMSQLPHLHAEEMKEEEACLLAAEAEIRRLERMALFG